MNSVRMVKLMILRFELALLIVGFSAICNAAQNVVIAERGKCAKYSIVIPDDASPSFVYAAEEMQRCTEKMTGVKLPIVKGEASLSDNSVFLAPADSLGGDGFRIRVDERKSVHVTGGRRGVLYGVYELLEKYGGCGWYASWHEVIPRKDKFSIPSDLDDTQKPAFEMRSTTWKDVKFNEDFAARLRYNGHPNDGLFNLAEKHGGAPLRFVERLPVCHTFNRILPPKKYFKDHPEWFSEINGVRRDQRTQICLTNPGAFETAYSNICEIIDAELAKRRAKGVEGLADQLVVGISQNDWRNFCECASCKAIDDREESHAGSLLHFVNGMAERLDQRYPGILVETLIYQYSRKATKTMRPRKNVIPCICSIECSFIAPLERETVAVNAAYMRDLRKWGALTDMLYVWDYTPGWNHFFYPLPNQRVFAANMRTFRANGCRYLFEEGGPKYADFAQLKAWLIAKFAWNPDQPIEPLLDQFFKGHYGAAAPYLRAYYDRMEELAAANENKKFSTWENNRPDVFPDSFIDWARGVFRQAEAAVSNDSVLSFNVRLQSFVPVCVRLDRRGAKAKWIWVTRDPSKFPGFDDVADDIRLAFDLRKELEPIGKMYLSNTSQKSDVSWKAWRKMLEFSRPEKGSDSVTLGVRDLHYRSTQFGRYVKDAEAYGGESIEVYGVQDYFPTVQLDFGHVAFDNDRKYIVRFRAKVVKAKNGKGEAFNATFAGRRIAPEVADVAEGWNWYAFPAGKLREAHMFELKCGRFAKGGGRAAVDAVFIDCLEISAEDAK